MASLVIFDDRVQTLVAAQPVGDRQALHLALSRVHGGGSTNLYGGWKAGADGLLPAAGQAALTRVILLSDGNANVGEITDATAMATLCAHAAERGVTTSTYGLGSHFNEDLMVEMAKRGGGNHYYGDSASDLFEPFAEEFDLISALCARHVRLSLAAPPHVRIRLLNDYPTAKAMRTFPVDPSARHCLRRRSLGTGRTGSAARRSPPMDARTVAASDRHRLGTRG
jgi:Ca-activated chloride channel family protein